MIDSSSPLQTVFDETDITGWVHAIDIDGDREVGLGADTPVVLASTVKVLIALEYARQAEAGQIDPLERIRATAADRLGGNGTAGCLDDADLSLRDLVLFMMTLSDNTAADLVLDRVGLDNVRSLAAELGLDNTRIFGGPRAILDTIAADLGAAQLADLAAVVPPTPARLLRTRAYDPAHTTASTPRDMTRLLRSIWRDEAGPAAACAVVRDLMGRQVNWHRIAAGMPETVAVAAKSGTLPALRNEIAVATYPDGSRFAVAVFTTIGTFEHRRADVDIAIGRAARLAIDAIRRQPVASAS